MVSSNTVTVRFVSNLDETTDFQPQFNKDGLITAIAQDYQSKEILMLAWMNQEALNKTIETGEAHYWSRSRQELWHKGATSGAVQIIKEIRVDCDQDALLLMVKQKGAGACHTNRLSCFYRTIEKATLIFKQ